MPATTAPVPGDARFHGVSFNPADRSSRVFGPEDLERELADPAVFSWIDLQAPDIAVLNDLLRRWDIDLVLTSHFDAPEVLPRIVEHHECLAFYLYEIVDPERHLDTSRDFAEIDFARMILILGGDFVITYHRRPLAAVAHVKDHCVESFRLAGKTPGFIAFLFLQHCVYDYAHLNLANDNFLDVIESRLHAQAEDPGVDDAMAIAGRNILTLKKLTASVTIVLMLLASKRSPFISNEARGYFHEMLLNAQSVRAAVDSSRDLLSGLLDSVQAAAASHTNEVARVLTVMSGVLLPLTLISGVYGMNFDNMPELHWKFGYFVTLGLMVVTATVLYTVFKRLGFVHGSRRARRPRP